MFDQLEKTVTLHERHGRYPQATSVEDFRQCLSAGRT